MRVYSQAVNENGDIYRAAVDTAFQSIKLFVIMATSAESVLILHLHGWIKSEPFIIVILFNKVYTATDLY